MNAVMQIIVLKSKSQLDPGLAFLLKKTKKGCHAEKTWDIIKMCRITVKSSTRRVVSSDGRAADHIGKDDSSNLSRLIFSGV